MHIQSNKIPDPIYPNIGGVNRSGIFRELLDEENVFNVYLKHLLIHFF